MAVKNKCDGSFFIYMFLLYVLLVYACTILYSTVKLKHDRFYCRQILIHRKQKLEKK